MAKPENYLPGLNLYYLEFKIVISCFIFELILWHGSCVVICRYGTMGKTVTRPCNKNIIKVLRLSRDMMLLADRGDENRQDRSCGVLYGTLRDSAYKLRSLAEQEIDIHKDAGLWDPDDSDSN